MDYLLHLQVRACSAVRVRYCQLSRILLSIIHRCFQRSGLLILADRDCYTVLRSVIAHSRSCSRTLLDLVLVRPFFRVMNRSEVCLSIVLHTHGLASVRAAFRHRCITLRAQTEAEVFIRRIAFSADYLLHLQVRACRDFFILNRQLIAIIIDIV